MKKNILILAVIFIIIILVIIINFKVNDLENFEIRKFNSEYEFYNKDDLNGINITTLINKATNNNEKYGIPKDENGNYILDDDYSIEIYVVLYDEEETKTFEMERFNKMGLEGFTNAFATATFKCTNVKYHENTGRVASMFFEVENY